jgi:hypothetical protein
MTDDAVAAQLQATFSELIAEPVAALGDEDADRRSALIAAQLLGLTVSRYILRLEPLASLPINDLVAAITPTIQRYLTQPIAGATKPSPLTS